MLLKRIIRNDQLGKQTSKQAQTNATRTKGASPQLLINYNFEMTNSNAND